MSALSTRRALQSLPKVNYSLTTLGAMAKGQATFPGGLDQQTPSLALQPGALRDAVNFEVSITGGYGRIAGYERVDGRAAPSAATFVIVQVTSFTNVPSVGAYIEQAGSGATGTVAAVNNVTGAYYMVVTRISGTFNDSGVVSTTGSLIVTAANSPFTVTASNSPVTITAGVTIGTATATTVSLSAETTAIYTAAAADIYRDLIQAVPGSGSVLGVVAMVFDNTDHLYAFRNNGAGTEALLWETSPAGWVQIPFFQKIAFTAGGTAVPADGATLTQGAVTALVKRIAQSSGDDSWTGDAAGILVITNITGGAFAAGAATLTGGATVTLSGASTQITLQPSGRFEFDKNNFIGSVEGRRIYGCDGANMAFEFDGETLVPISTGALDDRPSHICCHKNHLFLSNGSACIYSAAGLPYRFSAVDGGGSISVGDTVNAMKSLPGDQTTATMAIFQQSQIGLLYGNAPDTWEMVTYDDSTGARPYSIQDLFDIFSFDDLGVTTLQATLAFGNFSSSALTRNIQPFILAKRTQVVASSVNRLKGQYRVFFGDGYGLYLTVSNQTYLGAVPVLFPHPVTCCDESMTTSGAVAAYFGSSDGYVRQFDVGPSFDGEELYAYATLAWDALKSPRIRKRFRSGSIEISSDSFARVSFGYQLGYGTPLINQPVPVSYATNFSAAPFWDSFTWDDFTWDGMTLTPTDVDMTGWGENVQVTITSATNYIQPYQLNSVVYHWTPGRGIRV